MRKFFLILWIFFLTVSVSCVRATASFTEFGTAIDYGRGVWSAMMQGKAICYDAEGNPELCFGVQGGWFYAVNPATGEVRFKQKFSASQLGSMVTASNGKVYFNDYPQDGLKVYDPKDKTIQDVVAFHRQGGMILSSYADMDGKLYFGTYHAEGGRVLGFDTVTSQMTDYGVIRENAHYVQGVFADQEAVYAGVGVGAALQSVIRCDKSTGEKTIVFDDGGGTTFYYVYVTGNRIVTYMNGGIIVSDKISGERLATYSATIAPTVPYPNHPQKIYTAYQKDIVEIDLFNNRRTVVQQNVIEDSQIEKISGMEWFQIAGQWVLEFHTPFMEYVGYYNPETQQTVLNHLSEIPDTGPNIQCLEISPEGVIYMGGYQTATTAYDIAQKQFLYSIPNWPQNEGTGFLNGKTYFGTYTDAVLYRYNPEKPIKYIPYNYDGIYQGAEANPAMVYDIPESQDRPFVVKGYQDKLYVGTMPGYSMLGGALVIYEEDSEGNPSAETYRNVIPNQSITGIANRGNLVYLSGSIRGGLGITPTETQARISVFDTDTNTVIKTLIPDLPLVGKTSKTIGDLTFGPDGLLWACSEKEGLVFAMDPETLAVKKYAATNPGNDVGALARPLYLRWGADGMLYTTAGWNISVVDPETMEYNRLVSNCALMALDPDGNIWFAKGGVFYKLPVDQYSRLQQLLKKIDNLNEERYIPGDFQALKLAAEEAGRLSSGTPDAELVTAIQRLTAYKDKLYTLDSADALSAKINPVEQRILLSGKLLSEREVTVRIFAPDGTTVAVDQFDAISGSTDRSYSIHPLQSGTYRVYVGSQSMVNPVLRLIEIDLTGKSVFAESFFSIDSELHCGARVTNFSEEAKNVRLIAAIYTEIDGIERMTEIKSVSQQILPNQSESLSLELRKISNTIVRLFIWDDEFRPVTRLRVEKIK